MNCTDLPTSVGSVTLEYVENIRWPERVGNTIRLPKTDLFGIKTMNNGDYFLALYEFSFLSPEDNAPVGTITDRSIYIGGTQRSNTFSEDKLSENFLALIELGSYNPESKAKKIYESSEEDFYNEIYPNPFGINLPPGYECYHHLVKIVKLPFTMKTWNQVRMLEQKKEIDLKPNTEIKKRPFTIRGNINDSNQNYYIVHGGQIQYGALAPEELNGLFIIQLPTFKFK